jgi:hypothetical protein
MLRACDFIGRRNTAVGYVVGKVFLQIRENGELIFS